MPTASAMNAGREPDGSALPGSTEAQRMPYYRCAACDLTVYVGAGYSRRRVCPECGEDLRTATRVFVSDIPAPDLHRHMVRERQAAAAARRELETLLGKLCRAELDIAGLLTTELIANSVKHAGSRAGSYFTLDVYVSARSLRVTVTDGGSGFGQDARSEKRPTDGQWGLQLVDELADRWGVHRDERTTVWFELDRDPAAAP